MSEYDLHGNNDGFDQDEQEIEDLPPVDARTLIEVENACMTAYLTIFSPENGGADITYEKVIAAIEDGKIVYGLDEELIKKVVDGLIYDSPVIIAEGTPPQDGENGHVIKHFADTVALKPREREDGTVDFRDLGLITNITKGTEICDIIEPTEGVSGMDVLGRILPPKPGKPARVPQGTNTGLNGDGSKLLALCDGNLTYRGAFYSIESTFTIKDDVGVATGNIDFIGEVVVTQNVGEGYLIKAKGNVTIRGMVYGATIDSGGNITIRSGCVNSKLISKGNIDIKFAENCTINAKGDVKADSLINCNLNSQGELNVIGNPGSIIGGQCIVTKNITANYIGSKAYSHTHLTIGDFALVVEEKRHLERKLEEMNEEIFRIDQAVEYLNDIKARTGTLPPEREEMLKSVKNTKIQRTIEKNPIMHRIREIDESIDGKQGLSVTAKRILYPNVKVAISNSVLNVEGEYSRCKVVIEEGLAVIRMI